MGALWRRVQLFFSLRGLLAIVTALLTLLFAYQALWVPAAKEDTLLIQKVVLDDIENTIVTTGKLEAKHSVEVGARVSGQLQRILVEEGDYVEAGQLLVEIDATVFQTKVRNAEASLESKRALLHQLQAELELAELRARRNQGLYRKQAVSEDLMAKSETDVKVLNARITATKAQIKADMASLQGDKATLGYAKIYAPISGTVVSLKVRQGQMINANQNAPVLMKIADLHMLNLRAEISEADVNRIYRGMPLYFTTMGNGKRRWHSQIRQILPSPKIINDVVLYQALIDVDNRDGHLMDAMTAQIFFVIHQAQQVPVIPRGAIQMRNKKAWVSKQVDNAFIETSLVLGVGNRTHVSVKQGLVPGDAIVVGLQQPDKSPKKSQGVNASQPGGRRRGGF